MLIITNSSTDLFVAGEKGIGFFDARRVDQLPQILLPTRSFRQVVAAQQSQDAKSNRLSVFALDDKGELFFIEGTRVYEGNVTTFTFSPHPIRSGCSSISVQYNAQTNTDELIYVEENGRHLYHLQRDSTTFWSQYAISYRPPPGSAQSTQFVAAVSLITLTDKDGNPVPEGFGVQLSSESSTFVTVNDRASLLDPRTTDVGADLHGRLRIVAKADDSFVMPFYTLTLTDARGKSEEIKVDPMRRVNHVLKAFKTADDLKNAKSSSGEPLFPKGQGPVFDDVTNILRQFNDSTSSAPASFSWAVDQASGVKAQPVDPGILSAIANAGSKVFCDVFEAIRAGLVEVYAAGVCIVNKVVTLFIKIGDVIWSTLGSILDQGRSLVLTFMKKCLSIDIEHMWRLLKFAFDRSSIIKTQDVSTQALS
jgi:hypothetical protein